MFRGRLPVVNAPFEMRFGSVSGAGGGPVGGFRTDRHGNYCIVWSAEGGGFVIDNQESYGSTRIGTPLAGPLPPGCQTGDRGIPWNVASDLRTSWQYIIVLALAVLSMVVLAAGILGARIDRGQRLRVVGVGLTAATTVLLLAVWWTQIWRIHTSALIEPAAVS